MLSVHRPNPTPIEESSTKQPNGEKRFVNLLPVYTIYKQKFRRISEDEFKAILCRIISGKKMAKKLCKEFMKAKSVSEEIISFEQNNGFLCVARFMPLVALLAERANYKFIPTKVANLDFSRTPARFKEKFSYLLVDGFWFLGKVISDSLSEKDQVNRGNMFGFQKGDLGYWWAGVKILDWQYFISNKKENTQSAKFPSVNSCQKFVVQSPAGFQNFTNRAILNMNQHPMFFLSEEDWKNFNATVDCIKQKVKKRRCILDDQFSSDGLDDSSDYSLSGDSDASASHSKSQMSPLSSRHSLDSLMSKESVD